MLAPPARLFAVFFWFGATSFYHGVALWGALYYALATCVPYGRIGFGVVTWERWLAVASCTKVLSSSGEFSANRKRPHSGSFDADWRGFTRFCRHSENV